MTGMPLLAQLSSSSAARRCFSDPASRTSTLRSDYKAALISSDDDDDDDEHRQLVNNGDTLPVYNGNDNKLS